MDEDDDVIENQVATETEDEEITEEVTLDDEESEDETTEEGAETQEESEEEQETEDDELVVSIGEESPPPQDEKEKAPEWVKELRKTHRETVSKLKKAEARIQELEQPKTKVEPLGKKPTLEDFDYDTEQFEKEITKWYDKKREHDQKQQELEAAKQAEQQAWQTRLEEYNTAKTKLKVKDYDEAEAAIQDNFDVTQQGILLQGSDDPALLVYALGSNKTLVDQLSSIKDPVKFAFAVAKLEAKMKVSSRKTPPPPEKKPTSTQKAGPGDSTLDKLRAKAEKTGDYSEVIAYKTMLKSTKK